MSGSTNAHPSRQPPAPPASATAWMPLGSLSGRPPAAGGRGTRLLRSGRRPSRTRQLLAIALVESTVHRLQTAAVHEHGGEKTEHAVSRALPLPTLSRVATGYGDGRPAASSACLMARRGLRDGVNERRKVIGMTSWSYRSLLRASLTAQAGAGEPEHDPRLLHGCRYQGVLGAGGEQGIARRQGPRRQQAGQPGLAGAAGSRPRRGCDARRQGGAQECPVDSMRRPVPSGRRRALGGRRLRGRWRRSPGEPHASAAWPRRSRLAVSPDRRTASGAASGVGEPSRRVSRS